MLQLEGNWQAARDLSDTALSSRPLNFRLLVSRIQLEYEVGEFDQGGIYLDRLLEVQRLVPQPSYESAAVALIIPLVARISGNVRRFNAAAEAAALNAANVIASANRASGDARSRFLLAQLGFGEAG